MSTQQVQDPNAGLTKELLFKGTRKGESRKTGNPYHMISLHDPSSLENTDFFIPDNVEINTDGLKLKDRVIATFTLEFVNGRSQLALLAIKKA